jgi:3-oxoacyl-[acyl-carrier protein] reductase
MIPGHSWRSKMNRIALVTGASRGIGSAVALRLAADGFDIWGAYRSAEDRAMEVKNKIEGMGRTCVMARMDVSSFDEVQSALKPMIDGLDRGSQQLWVLVNNAGITRDNLLAWMQSDEWYDVIGTNLNSAFNVTRTVLDEMIRQKGGRIVSITSVAGRTGNTGQSNYAASKAGLMAFTRSLAKEIGRMKITVNAVAAGFIETDMTAALPAAELKKTIPMRRFGKPEEVAAAVSFLCSDDASYVTGAVLDVNGGIY